MKTVKLFGYSDDNIEIRGDLGKDEFGAFSPKYLHFDDGTVLHGGYDIVDGKGWTFKVVKLGDGASVKECEPMLEDGEHFSDVIEVAGNFTCVKAWESSEGPTRDDLREWFDSQSWRDFTREQLYAAMLELERT